MPGVISLSLLGVGIVYLAVACQNLPGFLGPSPGDASPRTPLGIAGVVLGLLALLLAVRALRRRPPAHQA